MDAAGRERLANALARERPSGGTAMRDAISAAWDDACREVKQTPADRSIRVLVVLTDGIDNASKPANETDALVRRIGFAKADGRGGHLGDPACKIPVFGIAFGGEADDRSLRAITGATGGETRRGDAAEIRAIFERFSELL